MLTEVHKMQIKKSIGYSYGLLPERIQITGVKNVPKNIVIEGGRIEIEVEYRHELKRGTEIFSINPSDLRKGVWRVWPEK